MARRRRGGNGARQQARVETQLAFGPQESALREAMIQTAMDYGTGISQEHAMGNALVRAANQTLPGVSRDYGRATSSFNADSRTVRREAGSNRPNADFIGHIIGADQGQARQNLAAEQASALQGVRQYRLSARSGETANIRGLRGSYLASQDKLQRAGSDLAAQKGLYQAKTLSDLLAAAAAYQLKVRDLNIKANTAGSNKASKRADFIATHGKPPEWFRTHSPKEISAWKRQWSAAGRAPSKGKGSKPKDRTAYGRTAVDGIEAIRSEIRQGTGKLTLNKLLAIAAQGGFTSTQTNKWVKFPKVGGDFVRAAWSIEHLGGLTPSDRRRLGDTSGVLRHHYRFLSPGDLAASQGINAAKGLGPSFHF